MILFRLTAGVVLVSAAWATLSMVQTLWMVLVPIVAGLAESGRPLHAVALGWWMVCPLVLAAAAAPIRRTPWPWVVCATLHLVVITATAARFAHWITPVVWVVVVVVLGCGVTSVVAAVGLRRPRIGPPTGAR